jgi:gliding motility-associated-like protein
MKKIFTLVSSLLIFISLSAQQDAALAPPNGNITSPVSGCALTANENVTVSIFNFGPGSITTDFDVSFSINGGPAVIETVVAPNIPQNTSFIYTFTATADLSVPGTYILSATVDVTGDPTPGNNTYSNYTVNSIAPSIGGTINGASAVCVSSNSGSLELSGNNGNVLRWESSTDGGGTWINISNTTTTQNYNNLTLQTRYRALVQNGSCTPAYSSVHIINIDPATIGGTLGGGTATICSGSSTGNMTLSGHIGTILRWEFSTSGTGGPWLPIAHTGTTYNTTLTTTTSFRVVVQSGTCPSANSTIRTITVRQPSVGGTVSPDTSYACAGTIVQLNLSGQTGSVLRWQWSNSGTAGWNDIASSNSATLNVEINFANPVRYFRAVVQNSPCPTAVSSIAVIYRIDATNAGTLSESNTVCSGDNLGTLNLENYFGDIQFWEYSEFSGGTWGAWTNIANTDDSYDYQDLTTTTRFRVRVQNGICEGSFSNEVTITVDSNSDGGTLSGSATVCEGNNNGNISISGQNGSIIDWEFSTDGGMNWSSTGVATSTFNYIDLTETTEYRVLIQNGVCPSTYSSTVEITVDPLSNGGTINGGGTVCSGNNSGTLNLIGNVGSVLNWEYSTDGGLTWINISNVSLSQNYINIATSTIYRARVLNGVCSAAYSETATINLDPTPVGGTMYGSTTVCSGSNSGVLTLIGFNGNIIDWEASTDGGGSWNSLGHTSNNYTYNNISETTTFRAVIASGSCPVEYSLTATVSVENPSIGGTTTGDATECAGANFGTISLSGETGEVIGWEFSTDNGVSWVNLSNNTNTQSYSNLLSTTLYRALVKNGVCNAVNSSSSTITVDAATHPGTISGSTTICSGSSGTLTLSGNSGNILNWEISTDNGGNWTTVANTSNTFDYNNIQSTTLFRASVQSGICPAVYTANAQVTVSELSVGGTIASNETVCSGNNSGTLTLSGETGSILNWEKSVDGGNTWLTVNNTGNFLNYNNLAATTSYRVSVKNGICSSVYSSIATISVDSASVAGTISGPEAVCFGNSASLTLSGQTGSILVWQFSTDNGNIWNTIASSDNNFESDELEENTIFRAIIQSGICPPVASPVFAVNVDPLTNGGNINGAQEVCAANNFGVLRLTGSVGQILNWQTSGDGGSNWQVLSNKTDSLIFNNLNTTASYRVLLSSGVCEEAFSEIATIQVTPRTIAGTVSGSTSVCPEASGTLQLQGFTGLVTFWQTSTDRGLTWEDDLSNTTATFVYAGLSDTTFFRAIVVNGVCPADTSSFASVNVFAKPEASFTANTVCIGNTTYFNNTSTIASGNIQFNLWDFGNGSASTATSPNTLYNTPGDYPVRLVTISDLNCKDTASVLVTVNPLPDARISAAGSTAFCDGDSLILNAPSGISVMYLWSNNDINQSTVVYESGWYSVLVSNINTSCAARDSIYITVYELPVANAGSDTTIRPGQNVNLNGSGGVFYSWSPSSLLNFPNSPNPTASIFSTTQFLLFVTDENGCSNSDSVTITLDGKPAFKIANIITPNGDGFNDTWIIENIELFPNNQITVVNRQGQPVFTTESYDNNWGGTFNGNILPDGTYYYVLKFTDTGEFQKGAVNILRNN